MDKPLYLDSRNRYDARNCEVGGANYYPYMGLKEWNINDSKT